MPSFTINVDGTDYTVGYDGTFNSPQGLLPALNNLGFGIFWIEEIGGNYVLTTVDNDNVFGDASTNPDPTTTTTSTTTTLGPITWTSTPSCAGDGINGTGVITVSGITGGSGTYLYAGIGDSESNAAADVLNPATRTDITGPTVQFTALTNGIYYIAIEDSVGGLHFSAQVNVSCTNTTTTTTTIAPTTTTTTSTTSTTSSSTTTTSSTTTSTTQAGPTTTSTTTTTTTLFAQTVRYASNATDACLAPTGTQNVTGNSTDFCTCTVFNSAGFVTLPNGNYVLAYNGNTLNINISGFPTTTATVYGGGCGTCPLSTSTTTTSTTPQQVWYQLTNCDGGGTVYTTNYDIGYAAVGDRVYGTVGSTPSTLVVASVLFSQPSATLIGIVNSGLTGCPSTSTTTTSTTLAVVTLTATASCTGIGLNGDGRIIANNFAGGSSTYQYAGIGTSEANAISAALNPATRVTISGASVTFSTLTNGNYWVAIIDSLGNIGISAQTAVSCNTTTTTSTTTTTTTIQQVWYAMDICYVGGTANSTNYDIGYASVGSRVFGTVSGTPRTLVVTAVLTSDPLGTQIGIANSGFTGCPATTSTTTTTTTVPPVTANISSVCTGVTQTITVDTFGGGTGTYFASTTTYADAASAQAGPTQAVSGSISYPNQANGTRYVYVTSTAGQPVVKQGGQTCTTTTTTTTTTTFTTSTTTTTTTLPPTTTTTTLPPVTANISSVCTGVTQTITVDSFAGGNGSTYFANTTTYDNPVSAQAGALQAVSGSISYPNQPNGTRYVYVTSTGGAPVIKQGGQVCTTTTSTSTTTTSTTPPPAGLTVVNIGGSGQPDSSTACADGTSFTYYASSDSGGTTPYTPTDNTLFYVWTDAGGTIPFDSGFGYVAALFTGDPITYATQNSGGNTYGLSFGAQC